MDFHDALDAARVVVARLKPFQALPEVIKAALAAEEAVRAAEARKAALQAENDGLELDRARLADELNSERVAAEAERAERKAGLAQLAQEDHDARNQLQTEYANALARVRDAVAVAEADAAAQKVALQAEIAALTATRDELAKQVNDAKAKYQAAFGG